MQTAAEELRQQGYQQGHQAGHQQGHQAGHQQGHQEGHQEGEASILLRLMERKFGTVPEKLRERIQQTDAQTLLDWSERILTAKTPEEVVH